MRIAYCLHGCIGGLTGKNGEKTYGADTVLKIAKEQLFKTIDTSNIDFFIHSWDTELESEINSLYNPKKIIVEPQIVFPIPDHLPNNTRVQSHYSRWYSAKQSLTLKNLYENENNFKYDLVILTRFDLYWLRAYDFSKLNVNNINIEQCLHKGNVFGYQGAKEIGDRLICSNSDNMNVFLDLYDKIDEYTTPGQCWQWNHISSHFMLPWHLHKYNLRNTIQFPYWFWDLNDMSVNKIESSNITLVRSIYELKKVNHEL